MKQIGKILISLLIAVMVIGGMTFNTDQDLMNVKADTYGWFSYEILTDNTIKITNCNVVFESDVMFTEDLNIPEQIDGKNVVCIGSYAFTNVPREILNINIPNGVTTIESHAFDGCSNIACISLPDTVADIGEKAFYNCKELEYINIPTNATIGKDAFTGCDKLKIDYATEQSTEVATTSGTKDETTYSKTVDTTTQFSENTTKVPTIKEITTANVSVGKTKVNQVTKKFISKKAIIKLKKISGAKYQVKISTTKKFKKKNTITKKVTKATFTIKNKKIQKKKVLYVKARAYRVSGGETYFGKWSNVKKVIVKK